MIKRETFFKKTSTQRQLAHSDQQKNVCNFKQIQSSLEENDESGGKNHHQHHYFKKLTEYILENRKDAEEKMQQHQRSLQYYREVVNQLSFKYQEFHDLKPLKCWLHSNQLAQNHKTQQIVLKSEYILDYHKKCLQSIKSEAAEKEEENAKFQEHRYDQFYKRLTQFQKKLAQHERKRLKKEEQFEKKMNKDTKDLIRELSHLSQQTGLRMRTAQSQLERLKISFRKTIAKQKEKRKSFNSTVDQALSNITTQIQLNKSFLCIPNDKK